MRAPINNNISVSKYMHKILILAQNRVTEQIMRIETSNQYRLHISYVICIFYIRTGSGSFSTIVY